VLSDTISLVAVDPYAFAPEVKPAVDEINLRFPALGRGGTYPEHGEDEAGGLPSRFYSADFWSTVKADHDEAFKWIIANADRLNLKYVISWCRIWSVERAVEGIRPYFQCSKPGASASQRHTNHIHTSFNESGFYMPSLSDIRKVIREELLRPEYLNAAADAKLKRDGSIVNNFTDNPSNKFVSEATALSVLGERTAPRP
jgi:hypothetical protein